MHIRRRCCWKQQQLLLLIKECWMIVVSTSLLYGIVVALVWVSEIVVRINIDVDCYCFLVMRWSLLASRGCILFLFLMFYDCRNGESWIVAEAWMALKTTTIETKIKTPPSSSASLQERTSKEIQATQSAISQRHCQEHQTSPAIWWLDREQIFF